MEVGLGFEATKSNSRNGASSWIFAAIIIYDHNFSDLKYT